MDCKKAKNLMSAYVDGMLENAEKSAFEAHIHTCKDCKRELDLLKNTLILLADAKYSAPENFTYEVREKLKSAVPEKRRTFARFGKFSAWAAAFVILAAVAIGNPVWKEFNDRTVKNAVEKSDKFVQNKDDGFMEKSSADITENAEKETADEKETESTKKTDNQEKSFDENKIYGKPTEKYSANTEKIQPETGGKQEIPQESGTLKTEETEKAQNKIQAGNGDTASKISRSTADEADTMPISIYSDYTAENSDTDRESAPDRGTFKMASGASNFAYEPAKITVNSKLNLAETEKKIGEILGFEVMGENGEITLTVTAEQYRLLAEKLGNDPDFDGFDDINTENITEISIFIK